MSLEFKAFPNKEEAQADIFSDFISNSKKQQGTLLEDFLSFNDLEKIKTEIKEFSFGFNTVDYKNIIPFKELTTRDIYIYAKPNGLGNPFPIEKFSDAILRIKNSINITIEEKTYYTDARIQWEKGIPFLVCSKAIKFELSEFEAGYNKRVSFKYDNKGTLNERINDMCFILALIENNAININGNRIDYDNLNLDNKDKFRQELKQMQKIKKLLLEFGVTKDLELDSMTKEDWNRIEFLMKKKPKIEDYNLGEFNSQLFRMSISNLLLVLMIEKENNYYKICNFFTNYYNISFVYEGTSDHIPISQYLILKADELIADNVSEDKIVRDIKKKHIKDKTEDFENMFILEAIKAYDNIENKDKLKKLILKLSKWFNNESKSEHSYLNYMQVKYRLEKLNKKDKIELKKLKNKYIDNLEFLVAISILLDDKEDAANTIKEMDDNVRKVFEDYPIYSLIKDEVITN